MAGKKQELYFELHNPDERGEMIGRYKAFIKENECEPGATDKQGTVQIGKWLAAVKKAKKNQESEHGIIQNDFSLDEELELNKAGIYANLSDQQWWEMYALLKKYMEENDNKLPTKLTKYAEKNLGYWCGTQRNMGEDRLPHNRYLALIAIKESFFDKKDKKTFLETKEEYDPLLQEYKRLHNNNEPKANEKFKDKNIGFYNQKLKQIKDIQSPKAEENNAEAEETSIWLKNFRLVCEFKEKYGRFPQPLESYNGIGIGSWCTMQRQLFNNGKLDVVPDKKKQGDGSAQKTKEQLLLDIGFDFDPRLTAWKKKYDAYASYKKQYHKEPAYGDIHENVNVGSWYYTQKSRKDKLDEKRWNLLAEVDSDIVKGVCNQ